MGKVYFQHKTAFDVCYDKYLINVSGRVTDNFLSDSISYDSIPNQIKELFKNREWILKPFKIDDAEKCYAVIEGNPNLERHSEKQNIIITGTDARGLYGYLILEPNKGIENSKYSRIDCYFPFEPTIEEVEIEMSEILIEIYKKDFLFEFLDYHFNNCFESTEDFLNYFNIFLKKYYPSNVAAFLDMSKKLRQWLNNKLDVYRIHLDEESKDNFWFQQLPTVEVDEKNTEIQLELDISGHKIVFLKELGVIDFLNKVFKAKNPSLNQTEFSKLLAPIIGINSETLRKGLSGYGQKTKDDPKSKDALNKVKSELLKFGIEL